MKGPKKPWFKFYPTDWASDQQLRICSLAARGLWIECMGLMHRADPYGHLLVNGQKPSVDQLAVLVGAAVDQIPGLLDELEKAGVYSMTRTGVIYSRRMTRDEKRRKDGLKSAESGTISGSRRSHEDVENQEEKLPPPEVIERPPPHPEARGQRPEKKDSDSVFAEFWQAYPSRGQATNPKKPAREKFARLVGSGTDPSVIVNGVKAYAAHCRKKGIFGTEYVMQAVRFLNQEVWEQYAQPPLLALNGGASADPPPDAKDDATAYLSNLENRRGDRVSVERYREIETKWPAWVAKYKHELERARKSA